MRQFSLIPFYYEWRLIDKDTHDTLHCLTDPDDCLYHKDGTPKTFEELKTWCMNDLILADTFYYKNHDYNGFLLIKDNRLNNVEEIPAAAEVMATTLYNYYGIELISVVNE